VPENEKFALFANGGAPQRNEAGPPLDISLMIEMIAYKRMHEANFCKLRIRM